MATKIWRGDAPSIAQVTDWVFGGTWEATDVVTITAGTKTVSVVAGSTTITTVVDTVFAALNALDADDYPEFAEVTWSRSSNSLRATADTAGVAFGFTVATTETGGGAADAQTIDGLATSPGTNSTANSGPNDWSVAANWSGNAVPVNSDDVIIQDSNVDIFYGLDQNGVTLTSLMIAADFTGKVGLPTIHAGTSTTGQYYEYRETRLKISSGVVRIGDGNGTGAPLIKLALGSNAAAVTVFKTGNAADTDYGALQLTNTNAGSTLAIFGGAVDVAMQPGDTSTIPSIVASGGVVRLGTGVTLTTVEANGQSQVEVRSAATTLKTQDGGRIQKLAAGTGAAVLVYGGPVEWKGGGTVTALTVGAGKTFDASGCLVAFTITDSTAYDQATINDAGGKATFTNATSCPDGAQSVRFVSKKGATVKVA